LAKEIPLNKLSFGEDNSASLVIQKNPSDELKEKGAAASKSQPKKGSVIAANDISSALLQKKLQCTKIQRQTQNLPQGLVVSLTRHE